MLIYYLKIVRYPTVSDSIRLNIPIPKKGGFPPNFGVEEIGHKSQGQNGAHKRTATRMSCRLTLFRMTFYVSLMLPALLHPSRLSRLSGPWDPSRPSAPWDPLHLPCPLHPSVPWDPLLLPCLLRPWDQWDPLHPWGPWGPLHPSRLSLTLVPWGPWDTHSRNRRSAPPQHQIRARHTAPNRCTGNSRTHNISCKSSYFFLRSAQSSAVKRTMHALPLFHHIL